MTVADDAEQRAWGVLQTANRTQAKGSTVRLVVPRAPEMSYELEPPLSEADLSAVEEYLLEHGYVAPANIDLRWGTYTITPAGFSWLEGGLPEPTDRLAELARGPGEEAAFESAVRTELEEERHRMEELERELEEALQKPPGAPEAQEAAGRSEERSWWRRKFGLD
jgi:hypothetical protein